MPYWGITGQHWPAAGSLLLPNIYPVMAHKRGENVA